MEIVVAVLSIIAPQVPTLIAWIVGLILAIVFWKRFTHASLLAFNGFALLILDMLIGTALMVWFPMRMGPQGASIIEVTDVLARVELGRAFIAAIAYSLLIAAIFSGRMPKIEVEREIEA